MFMQFVFFLKKTTATLCGAGAPLLGSAIGVHIMIVIKKMPVLVIRLIVRDYLNDSIWYNKQSIGPRKGVAMV